MNKIDLVGDASKSLRGGSAPREVVREAMRISAKADYAVRAVIELAAGPEGSTLSAREIATAQEIPQNFLENILAELRRAGIVHTHRGPGGGSSLARAPETITVGEILRAIEGPLAAVRDLPPEQLVYEGAARNLPAVWCRVQSCLHELLDAVTVAELADGSVVSQI
jgi:Rrf2 family protein